MKCGSYYLPCLIGFAGSVLVPSLLLLYINGLFPSFSHSFRVILMTVPFMIVSSIQADSYPLNYTICFRQNLSLNVLKWNLLTFNADKIQACKEQAWILIILWTKSPLKSLTFLITYIWAIIACIKIPLSTEITFPGQV